MGADTSNGATTVEAEAASSILDLIATHTDLITAAARSIMIVRQSAIAAYIER